MPIKTTCPSCHNKVRFPDEAAGRKFRCPHCTSVITAPGADLVSAAPAPSHKTSKPAPGSTPQPADNEKPASIYEFEVVEEPVKREPERPRKPKLQDNVDEENRESRPRKRKKKRRKLEDDEPMFPTWLWYAGSGGLLVLIVFIASLMAFRFGYKTEVFLYGLQFGIMLPLSVVILIASMFLSSALAGGISFGAAGPAIGKSFALLLVVNLVSLIPWAGLFLTPLIWLIGLMYLFDLDFWEARFLIFINWILNLLAKVFLVVVFVAWVMHGGPGLEGMEDFLEEPEFTTAESAAIDAILKLDGDFDTDENLPGEPVVEVTLTGPRVTDAALAQLKKLPELRRLDLSSSRVTDAGLQQLKELTKLRLLNVKGTKVTDKGTKELQKAIPGLRVMR